MMDSYRQNDVTHSHLGRISTGSELSRSIWPMGISDNVCIDCVLLHWGAAHCGRHYSQGRRNGGGRQVPIFIWWYKMDFDLSMARTQISRWCKSTTTKVWQTYERSQKPVISLNLHLLRFVSLKTFVVVWEHHLSTCVPHQDVTRLLCESSWFSFHSLITSQWNFMYTD